MNEAPPLPGSAQKRDSDHLTLLAIFHFIGGGLAVLGLLFLAGHFMLMHEIFANPKFLQNQKQGPSPAEIFAIVKWVYLIIGVWCVVSGLLNVISGFCLRARKARTFSLVVAGINCLHVPLGTVLGVFTLIVLLRDSVRELYAECRH